MSSDSDSLSGNGSDLRSDLLNVLVLGSGGREHALAWAAAKSPRCGDLVVAPGNGGTPGRREPVVVDDPSDVVALAKRLGTDIVLIGPDSAIAAGVCDALTAAGVLAFGASQAASELEWSKSAARAFCEQYSLPSPSYRVFERDQLEDAVAYVEAGGVPLVVKADGLAAGKGVVVPASVAETVVAVRAVLGGIVSAKVVLEELLCGDEISLLAFSDGTNVVTMPAAQDHKRIGEGDCGANTGGMGAYAPTPLCSPQLVRELTEKIVQPVIDACAQEGRPYRGVLYVGLMLTASGPKVLEFNCRFGDPEAQVLLPLLDTDLLDVAEACALGTLGKLSVTWSEKSACTVVLASPGYPAHPTTGTLISDFGANEPGSILFHAGTENDPAESGRLVTSGGRVVAVTGFGVSFEEARLRAYERANLISFDGKQMRRDIGWRALARTTGGYAASGVDIAEGNRAVDLLKGAVEKTHTSSVLAGIGSFGGAFDAKVLQGMTHPVLVASTDGVGTKVMLATAEGRLKGVGIDLVNHCVNDVLVQNARPLFFLDYVASSKIVPEQIADIVSGMSEACALNGCALLGGETAEMPGVYHDGHIDIAGTLVGIAEKADLLPRPNIAAGDVLIAMASSGPHTSGYSLLRKVFAGLPLDAMPAPLKRPLGDELLEPHRSYFPVLGPLLAGPVGSAIKALVHITGGGLLENLPRVFPAGLAAHVQLGSWPVPALFELVRNVSGLDAHELHRTLNMGVGMVIVCAHTDAAAIRSALSEETWIIGEVAPHDPETNGGTELVVLQ